MMVFGYGTWWSSGSTSEPARPGVPRGGRPSTVQTARTLRGLVRDSGKWGRAFATVGRSEGEQIREECEQTGGDAPRGGSSTGRSRVRRRVGRVAVALVDGEVACRPPMEHVLGRAHEAGTRSDVGPPR